jgi:hypothetical protein
MLDTDAIGAPCLLDAEQTERFFHLCRRGGSTPFIVVSSFVAVLLGRRSGRGDVVILGPSSLRDTRTELADIVGRLMSPTPVRIPVSCAPTWRDLFQRAGRSVLEAPLVPVSLVLGTNAIWMHPFGRVTVNVLPAPVGSSTTTIGKLRVTQGATFGDLRARNDLFFIASVMNGCMLVYVGGAASRIRQETVDALASELRELMTKLDLDATIPR